MKSNNISKENIKYIEKNSEILKRKYFSVYKKFLNLKIFGKPFYLYFQNGKKNILLQTDLNEHNLYKYEDEITFFLNILSKKNYKKNIKYDFDLYEILVCYFRSCYLLIRYFFYSKKQKKIRLLKTKVNYDLVIFSYLKPSNNLIKSRKSYWGDFSLHTKNKKILWIEQTFINKISELTNNNLHKNKLFENNLNNKNQSYPLECFFNLYSLISIFFKYTYYFLISFFLFLLIKYKIKSDKTLNHYFLTHKKIIIDSIFGKSLMRALIFNENFNLLFQFLGDFKKILYLKENLGWERSLLDVLRTINFEDKKIYGYFHTPVRYWDLKIENLDNKIHIYPKENILVSSHHCRKKLIKKNYDNNNIHLVETLRFSKNSLFSRKYKKKLNRILLIGSLNSNSTLEMIKVILEYLKKYNKDLNIDIKLHPITKIKFNNTRINLIQTDLNKLLRKKLYKIIILDADTSFSLELLLNKFKFLIFQDNLRLNTSFLRSENGFKFFSNYKDLKLSLNKSNPLPKKIKFCTSISRNKWLKVLNI